MKTIKLPCFGIVVEVGEDPYQYGNITSELHEETTHEFDTDYVVYNSMMDALESMILAHACAGIDIESPAYVEGIETAVSVCASNC